MTLLVCAYGQCGQPLDAEVFTLILVKQSKLQKVILK